MAGKKTPRIEGNIWGDRIQYGFKLHSCRLRFLFANDGCGMTVPTMNGLPWEHGRVAIMVLVLPLLNFRGCGFLNHFSLPHHLSHSSISSHFNISRSLNVEDENNHKAYKEAHDNHKSLQRN
ncbi:uncharacterized protein LOC131066241 isoform X2 [Cryptomeria japonica]|uniref:uncharacterized protein LOC131066241 isoform X2 n=1 Tax=Cryptomeria japonica TaxID=3369 RepID=UPI0027DA44E2|nr:uncharacterized protein LOC131066241 isoform X2 [Cryptomeria japonica]